MAPFEDYRHNLFYEGPSFNPSMYLIVDAWTRFPILYDSKDQPWIKFAILSGLKYWKLTNILTTNHGKSLPSHFCRCVLNVCNQDNMQFKNLGWQVYSDAARGWQHLIFCQNLGGCAPTLSTRFRHPCICKYLKRDVKYFLWFYILSSD